VRRRVPLREWSGVADGLRVITNYAGAAISGLTILKSSTLVTSNRPIEDWGALPGDVFVQGS
jgi:hypothetical protein